MRKVLIICTSIIFPLFSLSAQKNFENSIIVGVGPNKFSGDIGGDNFKNIFQNNLGYGGIVGYNRIMSNNIFGYSLYLEYEYFQGSDSEKYNGERRHFFTVSSMNIGSQLDIYFKGLLSNLAWICPKCQVISSFQKDFYEEKISRFNPYMTLGLKIGNNSACLDDIQRNDNIGTGFIYGVGFRYRLTDSFGIGMEMKETQYQSDKIDGYDPINCNNKHNDTAFNTKIILTLYIR